MARLILTHNNNIISTHKVPQGRQVTIGRHSDNDIIIDNLAVSGHHATVRLKDNQLLLTDLGSRNGTFVNNESVSDCRLAQQDWVGIGQHTIIVDLYESLSLESTANELIGRENLEEAGDQTMVLDRGASAKWIGFDYLSFLSGVHEDYELTGKAVSIGKNADADIKIGGFWALFAGEPSATITKMQDDYIISYQNGLIKPVVNGVKISKPTLLKHEDILELGPVKVQIRRVRRPSM